MSGVHTHPPAEVFFIDAPVGQRFCIYHAPDNNTVCRGAFIYVHPFGDEMNKSRRAVAVQARVLAAMGFAVLQIDLFGCGDSSGEFVDARWDIWKKDLALAKQWLETRVSVPACVWGLRLGALLALDVARDVGSGFERVILWQPVISGKTFLTQLLRQRVASEMLAATNEKNGNTQIMRTRWAEGEILEIGGYEIAPGLASAIDNLDAIDWQVPEKKIDWFEVVPEAGRMIAPARVAAIDNWQQQGAVVQAHCVPGVPFWATQEMTECSALLTATARAIEFDPL